METSEKYDVIQLVFLPYPKNKPKKDGWYLWAWKDKKGKQKLPFVTPVIFRRKHWYRAFDWREAEELDPEQYDFSFAKICERLHD